LEIDTYGSMKERHSMTVEEMLKPDSKMHFLDDEPSGMKELEAVESGKSSQEKHIKYIQYK
jgi:hypothetical protein